MQLYTDESITGNVRPAAQFPEPTKEEVGSAGPVWLLDGQDITRGVNSYPTRIL